MSDTPETDLIIRRVRSNELDFDDVLITLGAMEIQRNEALDKIAELESMRENWRMSSVCRTLEAERNEALQLARELRDALEQCREDSVSLAGEWDWKRGAGIRNERDMIEVDSHVVIADEALTKANQLLK